MAKQQKDNNDPKRQRLLVKKIFEKKKAIIFYLMQSIVQKKKCMLELNSKLRIAEEQICELSKYNKLSETILHRSINIDKFIPYINNSIKKAENAIVDIKKDIIALENEKEFEVESTKPNKKLITNMKKILSEMYSNNFDSVVQNEKRLFELKKQIEEYNVVDLFKKNSQQLEYCVKEHDLAKAKNMRLREMIAMSIERKKI